MEEERGRCTRRWSASCAPHRVEPHVPTHGRQEGVRPRERRNVDERSMRVLDELGPREEASDGAHEWHHGSCSRARPVLTKRVTTAIFVIRQVAQRSPRVGNWLVWAVLFGGWAADLKARTHEPARITKSSMWTAATAALQQRRSSTRKLTIFAKAASPGVRATTSLPSGLSELHGEHHGGADRRDATGPGRAHRPARAKHAAVRSRRGRT